MDELNVNDSYVHKLKMSAQLSLRMNSNTCFVKRNVPFTLMLFRGDKKMGEISEKCRL